jgi:hypothetical protein
MRWILLPICIVLLLTPAWADDIAIIKSVHGSVTIKRSDQLLKVQQSDKLRVGDILITDKNSQVGIIFHDGSVLSLKERSFFRIKEFEFIPIENKFTFKLKLKKGTALFESGKIGTLSPENFSLEIPEGTIGIRGTKFLVEVR